MFEQLTNQLTQLYSPDVIFLFGSQANGSATEKSDVDICIVVETDNKRRLLAQMYFSIDYDKPIDIVIYTPEEWKQCIEDTTSFAYKINQEGVKLYG